MKKRGKYERVPEPKVETSRYEKMKKRTLLQSYIISLISLCLCATMLMGTTMAWFTDDVIVENNEIYTGILKADLLYNDKSLDGENAPKVFDDDIKWEPDHVEVRTLTVVNAGELAMKYRLTFSQNSTATVAADENAPTFEALTSQFIVYAKQGALEEGETVSFASLTKENSEWKFVGNLYDVLTKEETVFDGQLDNKGEDSKEKTATYSIAVYMHSDAPKELMGQKINFGVKLTAYQLGMPEPDNVTEPDSGAGSGEETGVAWYDVCEVKDGDNIVITSGTADNYAEIAHSGGNLTIKNVTFKNGLTIYTNNTENAGKVTLENCTIYLNDGSGDPAYTSRTQYKADYGLNLNLANGSDIEFTFKNCTFTAADSHKYDTKSKSGYNVYIGGGYSAKSVTFTGCTFEKSGKHGIGCSSEGASQYYALTVTGCNFKDWNNNTEVTNGAAIRGNLPSADFSANITINGNTFGDSNSSTQTTVAIDSWNGSWS